MPEFAVHLTVDVPFPDDDDTLDELVEGLADVHAAIGSDSASRLSLQCTVDATDLVDAVRVGHQVADRASGVVGRTGSVVAVEAYTIAEFDRMQGPPFAAELAEAPRHPEEPR